MTFLIGCWLLFSFTLFMAVGQGQTPDHELFQYAMILHEEFQEVPASAMERTSSSATITRDERKMIDSSNLRRQAQHASSSSSPLVVPSSCHALSPRNAYACTERDNFCLDSQENITCGEEFGNYDCRCTSGDGTISNTNNETSCPYCQLETANGVIVCQVTGSSTTFVDPSFELMTCSCDYLGNGYLVQVCYPQTSRPTSAPQTSSYYY